MNKDDLIKKLGNIDLPEINLPTHQHRLKTALLNSGYLKKQTTMSLIKKFAFVGTIAVMAILVVGFGFFGNQGGGKFSSRYAYAKELVSQAQKQLDEMGVAVAISDGKTGVVKWLTPDADGNIRDEKGNIIFTTSPKGGLVPVSNDPSSLNGLVTMKDEFDLVLEDASRAKDLEYLGDKVLPDGKRIKVLRFTKEKRTFILGVDEKNLPVAKIVIYYDDKGNVVGGGAAIGVDMPHLNIFDKIDKKCIKETMNNIDEKKIVKCIKERVKNIDEKKVEKCINEIFNTTDEKSIEECTNEIINKVGEKNMEKCFDEAINNTDKEKMEKCSINAIDKNIEKSTDEMIKFWTEDLENTPKEK